MSIDILITHIMINKYYYCSNNRLQRNKLDFPIIPYYSHYKHFPADLETGIRKLG